MVMDIKCVLALRDYLNHCELRGLLGVRAKCQCHEHNGGACNSHVYFVCLSAGDTVEN